MIECNVILDAAKELPEELRQQYFDRYNNAKCPCKAAYLTPPCKDAKQEKKEETK